MKKKNRLVLLPALAAFFLSSCSSGDSPISDSDIMRKIFPNIWDFLIQLIAFIVLIVIVFFIAYKPLKAWIEKRQKFIQDGIDNAKKADESLKSIEKKKEEAIQEAKLEAKGIVDKARSQAEAQAKDIVDAAHLEATKTKESAEEDIALAKKKAQKEIHDEIVTVALSASEKLLGREVNEKDEKKLLDEFVDDVKKGK